MTTLERERRGGISNKDFVLKWKNADARSYHFPVLLCPEDEGGYSIHAINLPGVTSQGDTRNEAISNIREALEGAIELYLEEGDIPWGQAELDRGPGCIELRLAIRV